MNVVEIAAWIIIARAVLAFILAFGKAMLEKK